jgi:hypothetical protein
MRGGGDAMRGGGDANNRGEGCDFFLSLPFVFALLETRFFFFLPLMCARQMSKCLSHFALRCWTHLTKYDAST